MNCVIILARWRSAHALASGLMLKTIGTRGFFHASPAFWNSLPDDLRDPELSIGLFQEQIENFPFFSNLKFVFCFLNLVFLSSTLPTSKPFLKFCLISSLLCRARQRDFLLIILKKQHVYRNTVHRPSTH